MFLRDPNEMSNLYRGPAIYASFQVSACLAKWLQRRRFLKIDQSKKKPIHCSNHVCEKMETKRAVCIDDFPRMLPTKFLFNWQNGYREDHVYKSANQTEELPVVVIFGTK